MDEEQFTANNDLCRRVRDNAGSSFIANSAVFACKIVIVRKDLNYLALGSSFLTFMRL
jgi:hypothetical protein